MTMSLPEKVFDFTAQNSLFSAPCRLIVGVSGGADSMALLHALCTWPQPGLQIVVVHVHHGLRGKSADRDAAFVETQCDRLGVPSLVVRSDVAALAEQTGCGVEETGRRERYRIFEEVRAAQQADYILTAHNSDDQTETVLMHILRGCGTDGLQGIPVVRGYIRRPLLCCSRAEIEVYCKEKNIPYVTDETNTDIAYTRNRIRHEILPVLRQVNPSVDDALRRLSAHGSEDSHFLCGLALDALNQALLPDGGYRVAFFTQQPLSIRRRMITALFERLELPNVEERHILAVERCLYQEVGGVTLPTGVQLCVAQGRLYVSETVSIPQPISVPELPFTFTWKEHVFRLEVCTAEANVHKKFLQYSIDCDTIQGGLCIRPRREGDRLHPAGRGVGKSLKKLMNEWHVPNEERDCFPLLCDEAGVLLVPGYACDERVRVKGDTKHFLVWCSPTEQG